MVQLFVTAIRWQLFSPVFSLNISPKLTQLLSKPITLPYLREQNCLDFIEKHHLASNRTYVFS